MLHLGLGSRVPRAFTRFKALLLLAEPTNERNLVGTFLSSITRHSDGHSFLSGSIVCHTGNGCFEHARKFTYPPPSIRSGKTTSGNHLQDVHMAMAGGLLKKQFPAKAGFQPIACDSKHL